MAHRSDARYLFEMNDLRAVRVARALALMGGAAVVACGPSETTPNPVALADATIDSSAPIDTSTSDTGSQAFDRFVAEDGEDVGPHGSCYSDFSGALPCPEGFFCDWDGKTEPRCVSAVTSNADATNNEPCGLITCVGDDQCFCLMEATSFCECGITGPLPPPDLPRA